MTPETHKGLFNPLWVSDDTIVLMTPNMHILSGIIVSPTVGETMPEWPICLTGKLGRGSGTYRFFQITHNQAQNGRHDKERRYP